MEHILSHAARNALLSAATAVGLLVSALVPSSRAVAQQGECLAQAGTLSGFKPTDCLQEGGTQIGGVPNGDHFTPPGFIRNWVLTKGPELVIVDAGYSNIFTVTETGLYTIHTLIFDPSTLDLGIIQPGITTGFDVNSLLIQGGGSICASLDVTGTSVLVDNPDAGSLTAMSASLCLTEGEATLSAMPNGNAYVPAGYSVAYVLTQGPGLVIVNAGGEPSFTVSEPGDYTIHTLVYDPATLDLGVVELGVTTGFDVNGLLIQGGGGICAALDVPGAQFEVAADCPCVADAGTLAGFKPTDCLQEGGTMIGGVPNGDAVVPAGYSTLYVLTQGPGLVIVDAGPSPIFTVNSIGSYTVHTLVYDPATLDLSIVEFGVTTGFDVNSLLIQGGGSICASLDVTGTTILVDNPDAGSLSAVLAEVCLNDGGATVAATVSSAPYVPAGYQVAYVLTQGPGLVIVNAGAEPSFVVEASGDYTVHTLVYDPATLDLGIVQPGITTGFDVNSLLIQGGGEICAALDVVGAPVSVIVCDEPCTANAGTLTADMYELCLQDGGATVSATANGDALVPDGYSVLYVLTQGSDLVIVDAAADPAFTVSAAGIYTVHTLVYDPATLDLGIVEFGVTTGVDVNGLLIQGGGSICASLDVAGAQVVVLDCEPVCAANAGTLTAATTDICLVDGQATLTASPNGDAFVPAGFMTIHVLTQGPELVIINAGATPSFTVDEPGSYTIHTLVFDPATVDLGIVQLGVTTGFDVNALLIQGGGTICASLDVPGAAFQVNACGDVCDAQAGTLSATAGQVCLTATGASISATANGDASVPAGYQQVYVLTEGPGLVIVNAGPAPAFDVIAEGTYTIHSLVYDPATLDLGIVEFGTTTGFDVNGLLIQGGGSICASLDVAGAPVSVIACGNACVADAGTLTPFEQAVCLTDAGATFGAEPNGDALVPPGYEVVYVLTSGDGLVIEQVNASPVFTVANTGNYTIHTLVYDPATLDLSIVEFGTTSGVDVNGLLIQGGGTICASLDVAGAPTQVVDCNTICNVNAGTLSADAAEVCLVNGSAAIGASPNNDAFKPAGFETIFVLTQGPGLVIVNASVTPDFVVDAPGLYTIHTLAFNPSTIDLSLVEFGVTTGFDVNALLVQGGGTICGSLDVAGAPVLVSDCNALVAWPNPATADLTLELEGMGSGRLEVDILDMQGARTTLSTSIAADQPMHRIDVSDLRPGQYILRVTSSSGVRTVRFSKVDR